MKKIFIYYSLTGNGDLVAENLNNKGYTIKKVITKERLPKFFFLRILVGGYKAGLGYKDRIEDLDLDINDYDEIIIGSPIWNGKLSCPINRLLDIIDFSDRKITFILYSGSGKIVKAIKQIEKICPQYEIINLVEPKKNTKELKKLNIKE